MNIDTASREELRRISGLERPSAIRRFLIRERIPFMIGADGWPRVLQAIIAERLGSKPALTASNEPKLKLRNSA